MSIYRNTFIKFSLAAAMLTAAAGGALAQTANRIDYRVGPIQYPEAYYAMAPSYEYNLLVGPGVTTVGIAPGDRTTPVGAD
jgi:hypothetical protein